MKLDEVKKLFEDCAVRIDDLSELTKYAPFIVFSEKAAALNEYIRTNLAEPMMSSQNVIILDDNENFIVDTSNTKGIENLDIISNSLELADDDIPGNLRNDVEEARLYRKRYNNDPQAALMKASEVYQEADTSLNIRR